MAKRFFQLKEKMSTGEALKVFGLSQVPAETELKTLYRNLVKTNHPDAGGDLETMKQINMAWDVLKDSPTRGSSFGGAKSQQAYDDFQKEAQEEKVRYFNLAKEIFTKEFDLNAFVEYLQAFSSEKLYGEYSDNEKEFKKEHARRGYQPKIKVRTEDNKTYFEIDYHIVRAFIDGGLGHENIDERDILFDLSYSTSIYHDSRSHKIAQRSYQWGKKYSNVGDFKELMPPLKLKKIFGGTKVSFRKADMLLALTRECNATITGDKIFLYPFGTKKFYFYVNREVWSDNYRSGAKTVFYNFGNMILIDPSTGKLTTKFNLTDKYTSIHFYETPVGLEKVLSFFKEIEKYVKKNHLSFEENSLEIKDFIQGISKDWFKAVEGE